MRVEPPYYCRGTADAEITLHRLNSRQFIRDGSGPNVVCINNNPEAISCALSASDGSSEECGTGNERAGTDHAGAEIVVSSRFIDIHVCLETWH